MLSAKKLINLSCNTSTLNQLYHIAHKKVEFYDGENLVKPESENAYKFELFLHNFLPFVDDGKFGVISVKREDEFAPVKNANPLPQESDTSMNHFPVDTPAIACTLINF